MVLKKYKLGDIAKIEISDVDKITTGLSPKKRVYFSAIIVR